MSADRVRSRPGLRRPVRWLMLQPFVFAWLTCAMGQTLSLPPRPANALNGDELAQRMAPLSLTDREREIASQVLSGNVPNFLRRLSPVQVGDVAAGKTNTATFYCTPDYLALGSDDDHLLVPISPNTAQKLADALDCSLPTRKMVDAIYQAAEVKLAPSPIPPSAAMTTVAVFSNHNETVRAQRAAQLPAHPLGALVAGHQKDLVITARLANAPGKVAIYGWHQTNGRPIQPLYLGHTAAWVDYSQCARFIAQKLVVNGRTQTVDQVLADPALAGLLSDEGVISNPRYPTNDLPQPAQRPDRKNPDAAHNTDAISPASAAAPSRLDFLDYTNFHERVASFTLEPEVKIHINAPPPEKLASAKKVLLIYYALPNGNTTAQTIGRSMAAGDDWHFDIQHIGAQTRFLRELRPDQAIVVAYLENQLKSWPAWRKKYGDQAIPTVLDAVRRQFASDKLEIALSGHSGGGSLIFGYLNAIESLPPEVVRLGFLDSNYAYDRALGHTAKLVKWLKSSDRHFLCVLAYNDAVALLDGKPFVSAAGGTWGRSHAMQTDLAEEFQFSRQADAEFERFSALDGRIQFILKENPERKIFHTVQVERNGFIHSLLCGTAAENQGYQYFGPRAYTNWVAGVPEAQ